MSFSKITHHMSRIAETQQYKINRITPIIKLSQYSESIFLQGGFFYSDDGQSIPTSKLPGWVFSAMSSLTPAALASAGFKEVPKPDSSQLSAPSLAPGMWQCPECAKTMDERNREAHLAKHAKHANAQPAAKPTESAVQH